MLLEIRIVPIPQGARENLIRMVSVDFNQMMGMQNYPRDILPLYAQGHSAAQYLIHLGGGGTQGRREIYRFMDDAMKNDDWAGALKNNYGLTPSQFQQDWLKDFVKNGYRSRGY